MRVYNGRGNWQCEGESEEIRREKGGEEGWIEGGLRE